MLIPALVCAIVSIILMRAGFFTLFFLVPLGFCTVAYGPGAAWLGFVYAVVGNTVLSIGDSLRHGLPVSGIDVLYFTVLVLGFTRIMADNPLENGWIPAFPKIRRVFRFIAASIAGALAFFFVVFVLSRDENFIALLRAHAEAISSAYITVSGADAAQMTVLERTLTSERIIESLMGVIIRGGALFSVFFLFFFSRQLALILGSYFRRQKRSGMAMNGDLINFHVPRKTIWIFSFCLPAILLFRTVSAEIFEIAVWNLLVICIMMFLAQGGGIVLFSLARRSLPPVIRLFGSIIVIFLLFSPGINILVFIALILLGIAENWLPLRIKKEDIV